MMRRNLLGVVAGLVLALAPLSAMSAGNTTETKTSETYKQLDLFGTVFERVRANYVRKVTDKELIESAIKGMLSSLDPHSSYLDAKNYREMQVQTRGEFGGLGIEVTMESGVIKVISPIDDTPAFHAGIQPGDLITHLDGAPIQGMTLSKAVERMRGKVNTTIRLSIRRQGRDPFDVTITRAVIKIRSVRSRVEGKIGYLRITSFTEQTKHGLDKAIKKIRDEVGDKLQGFVLDLRNNPGGLLDQAIAVSDSFLDRGEIVSTRGRRPEQSQRWNAKKGDEAAGLPIVLLINGGSASASEIVAGALQDHRRALVLGTRSFGKGSVQTIVPLMGHGAMRLTTARYFTPRGRSIQAKGIEPDIIVEQAKIEPIKKRARRSEKDLPGALKNPDDQKKTPAAEKKDGAAKPGPGADAGAAKGAPKGGNGAAKPAAAGKSDAGAKKKPAVKRPFDYQLSRALDLLRGVAMFSSRAVN